MQTFIGGSSNIEIVLQVTDLSGKRYYKDAAIYPLSGITPDTTMAMSKGSSYLVFKDSDSAHLNIMPACSNEA